MTQVDSPRVIAWFSCGVPSAVAAKLAVEKYGDRCVVAYCDLSEDEHPDNERFFREVEKWIGVTIIRLKNENYSNRYEVYNKTGWLVGPSGARCTAELKKKVRRAFQNEDDIHIWGFTSEESKRAKKYEWNNPELTSEWILIDHGISREECHRIIATAGIEQPIMYSLGYKNNNCIGCVKGGMGYWNKIRVDFPEEFEKMAQQERKMDVACCSREIGKRGTPEHRRVNVFLDELSPDAGSFRTEPSISCGIVCEAEQLEMELS